MGDFTDNTSMLYFHIYYGDGRYLVQKLHWYETLDKYSGEPIGPHFGVETDARRAANVLNHIATTEAIGDFLFFLNRVRTTV